MEALAITLPQIHQRSTGKNPSVEQLAKIAQQSFPLLALVSSLGGPRGRPAFVLACIYLRANAQHLQRRRHVDLVRNAHVAKVHGEGLAPHAKVANVEHRQISRQRQHDGLFVVPTERSFLAVLVRNADALGTGLGAATNPKLGVCFSKGK